MDSTFNKTTPNDITGDKDDLLEAPRIADPKFPPGSISSLIHAELQGLVDGTLDTTLDVIVPPVLKGWYPIIRDVYHDFGLIIHEDDPEFKKLCVTDRTERATSTFNIISDTMRRPNNRLDEDPTKRSAYGHGKDELIEDYEDLFLIEYAAERFVNED
ncbi:hypothetical protein EJ05DRAFT_483852 [Pseudovirgaria hyperparasitica]|uniref:Uncharacterized protein n=1 Tax=Pseudovirgaria hyperparasitica TaxID=470096 RepID=A0A6A6WII9_9PEZI|nr:uncharacterized protein EJ05DRAFT_483852 [Pseudovirgaria hyperparasitica]KAF2761487.1 hypothetical protein EJ05DRAFT_483852 [Pseudovirgaria hyperparasitica]